MEQIRNNPIIRIAAGVLVLLAIVSVLVLRLELNDLKEQRGKFKAGLSTLGFSSAREFELARMSDADMNRIEKAVREYGEQLRSQKDHAERLREQLAGKQPEDLEALKKLCKELDAACKKA